MKLDGVRELDGKIRELERRLESLKSSIFPTPELDGQPRAKMHYSRIEKITVSIVDLERELAELRAEQFSERIDLIAALFKRVRHADAFTVLEMRYVRCQDFKTIAKTMHFSEGRVYELHRRGVRDFDAVDKN